MQASYWLALPQDWVVWSSLYLLSRWLFSRSIYTSIGKLAILLYMERHELSQGSRRSVHRMTQRKQIILERPEQQSFEGVDSALRLVSASFAVKSVSIVPPGTLSALENPPKYPTPTLKSDHNERECSRLGRPPGSVGNSSASIPANPG